MGWLIVATYVVVAALIAGWLYGYDRNEGWIAMACLWPLWPFIALVVFVSWIGYKANKFLSK
jgi:hypothetical protein